MNATPKKWECYVLPGPTEGRPFTGRWITVIAETRSEAIREAAREQGVHTMFVRKVRRLHERDTLHKEN